jgi:peptidoglycan hydrolase CwlO-like protein
MDWTQTLTILTVTVGSVLFFHRSMNEQNKALDDRHREDINKVNERIDRTDARIDRTETLWAELLKEIHSIKLSISSREK